ncbi:ArsR family transcriptional regulator, partial [Streptomyces sp. SID7982]|nr:ArsR family transcriptional regulator [Streptomyces sp. SID7982]
MELEQRVAELERRLTALERGDPESPRLGDGDFWAL